MAQEVIIVGEDDGLVGSLILGILVICIVAGICITIEEFFKSPGMILGRWSENILISISIAWPTLAFIGGLIVVAIILILIEAILPKI